MRSDMSLQFPALWLLLGVGERYKLVETVDDAARLLVHHWASQEGCEYFGAMAACREALMGVVPAVAAREALIRAADEALVSYICMIQGGGGFNLLGSGGPAGKKGSQYRS